MMFGLEIIEVEADTIIVHDGIRWSVDDANCVQVNGTLYVTATTKAKMDRRAPARHPATNIGE